MAKNPKIRSQIIVTLIALTTIIGCFLLFGQRTQIGQNLKQQTDKMLKIEYIPNQQVAIENTQAFQKQEAVYQNFRNKFRMHFQTIGTASFADSSRLIVISEPPPFLEMDSVENICQKYNHKTITKYFKIGYDGRITDFAIILANTTNENMQNLLKKISKAMYLSDYKPNSLDLLSKKERHYFAGQNLNYQISLSDFNDWFFKTGEKFINSRDTSKTLTINQMFKFKCRGVYFSKEPGLVAWSLRRNSDIKSQLADIRRFALDADLVLGALRDPYTLVIIGRERETPLEVLPPLRVESILLLASISKKEISQSLDINDFLAGKMSDGRDWCPTYLSRELENTELGHLLTITDILLKDWSESGTIQEAFYRYPNPGRYPFDKPLFKKLGLPQLVYNWNTADAMYAIDMPTNTIYTLNRTGSLPVSYFNSQERSESVGAQYEQQAWDYFANLGNTDIARVVEYTALYQLFMDNGIHYSGNLHGSFPKNKPYLLASPCLSMLNVFRNLTDAQINLLSDTLSKIHFNMYGYKEVNRQMRENEGQYHFLYTEENQKEIYHNAYKNEKDYLEGQLRDTRATLKKLSPESLNFMARYLSYPRGTTVIKDQATYNRINEAKNLNLLMRSIGKNNLHLLGLDLARVKDFYVNNLSKSGGRYLKTPSIILTYNDFVTTGGHNISSKISRVHSMSNYNKTNNSASPSQTNYTPTDNRPTAQNAPTTTKTATPIKGTAPTTHSSGATHPTSTARPQPTTASSGGNQPIGRPRSSVIPTTARTTRGF